MAIADKVHCLEQDFWFWEVYEESVRVNLSARAIRIEEGWVFIDPVELSGDALVVFSSIPAAAIFLTNGNHARAALTFRKRFGAPIVAHPDAVGELECPVDRVWKPERVLFEGVRGIPIPGGGPGEMALLDARGRLHVGDALIHLPETGFSLLPDKYCEDPVRMRASLKALLDQEFQAITFAHGTPIFEKGKEKLRELLSRGA